MEHKYPLDPKKLKEVNFAKYQGKPPSWEIIERVIEKSGLKMLVKFERVWKIPEGSLTLYKIGERILSPRYWHIFYEYNSLILFNGLAYKRGTTHKQNATILTTNKHLLNGIRQEPNPAR